MDSFMKMTSTELGLIWSSYLNDSMSICILEYFLQHVEEADIRTVMERAAVLSRSHIEHVTLLMNQEKFPIPNGFNTNADVNPKALRLFSDDFYIMYLDSMAMIGMVTYTAAYASSTRKDLREFYQGCLNESVQLHNNCLELLLNKGLFVKPAFISPPDRSEFVDNRSYLTGYFGSRRPLNAMEITNLYLNIQRNALGKALMTGFAQVAQSKKVRQHMERGKDIASKHVKIFTDLLAADDLPAPTIHDHHVTDSTSHIFSDGLLMFHVSALCAAGIGNYGVALGSSLRRDLGVTFARLQGEVALYSEDGAELMVDNGWLEKPPMAEDRHALASQK